MERLTTNRLAAVMVLAAACGLWTIFEAAGLAEGRRPAKDLWVYVGTYTDGASKGIYRLTMDLDSGALAPPVLVAELSSPSFLAIHPNQRFLYAVNEVSNFAGKPSGSVSALSLDPKSGNLALLNQQPSGGSGPCHLVVDHAGKQVLVANYGRGSVAALPIQSDGKLGEATATVQHRGSSVNPQRQEGPHAHSINVSADDRFAVAADLGLDKVFVYRLDSAKGTLTPNDPPFAPVAAGAGPRHFAFHPNGRNAYVINELQSTITAFAYDAQRGILKELQTISALPQGFQGTSHAAEVQVHPTGRFLYGSNRGHDSIAIFKIDDKTGMLSLVGHQASQIKTPRNFAIDPTGAYLLVANQGSNSIVVFKMDPQTGALKETGPVAQVPAPVCIRMIDIER